eukprot:scaffold29596_cov32-Tisochrysis_lutea.AAC.2
MGATGRNWVQLGAGAHRVNDSLYSGAVRRLGFAVQKPDVDELRDRNHPSSDALEHSGLAGTVLRGSWRGMKMKRTCHIRRAMWPSTTHNLPGSSRLRPPKEAFVAAVRRDGERQG